MKSKSSKIARILSWNFTDKFSSLLSAVYFCLKASTFLLAPLITYGVTDSILISCIIAYRGYGFMFGDENDVDNDNLDSELFEKDSNDQKPNSQNKVIGLSAEDTLFVENYNATFLSHLHVILESSRKLNKILKGNEFKISPYDEFKLLMKEKYPDIDLQEIERGKCRYSIIRFANSEAHSVGIFVPSLVE